MEQLSPLDNQRFNNNRTPRSRKLLQPIKEEKPTVLDLSHQLRKGDQLFKDFLDLKNNFDTVMIEYKQNNQTFTNIDTQLKKIDQQIRIKSLQKKQNSKINHLPHNFKTKKRQQKVTQFKEMLKQIQAGKNNKYSDFSDRVDRLSAELHKGRQPQNLQFQFPTKNYYPVRKDKEHKYNNSVQNFTGLHGSKETGGFKRYVREWSGQLKPQQQIISFRPNLTKPMISQVKEKGEKKTILLSPFQVRIFSPRAVFNQQTLNTRDFSLQDQRQGDQMSMRSHWDLDNVDSVFMNKEFLITADFRKTEQIERSLNVKVTIQSLCFFDVQNLFVIVYGPAGMDLEVEPRRIFYSTINQHTPQTFEVWLNRQSLQQGGFHLQITYNISGVKRKVNTKVLVPIFYRINSFKVSESDFERAWEQKEKQIYIPPRRLNISHTQWRQRLTSLFFISQIPSMENGLVICQQIASFEYISCPATILLRIQHLVGNKVTIKIKSSQTLDKRTQEQVLDLINQLFQYS